MRIRTMALALPLVVGGAACSTTSAQRAQAAGPPPVAATEREGNAPQNQAENQPGSGVGATAPGAPATASGDVRAHSDDQVISGTIRSVSPRSLTIASEDGSERTLQLVPQTTVSVNGQEAQSTDLQEGQPVRASFSTAEDGEIAVDVRAGSASGEDPSGSTGFPGTPGAGPMPEPGGGGPQSGDQPAEGHLPRQR
ncbi:MAG TPA: hypothetical protein VF841_19935 [Anaeromyxobacter sp.]